MLLCRFVLLIEWMKDTVLFCYSFSFFFIVPTSSPLMKRFVTSIRCFKSSWKLIISHLVSNVDVRRKTQGRCFPTLVCLFRRLSFALGRSCLSQWAYCLLIAKHWIFDGEHDRTLMAWDVSEWDGGGEKGGVVFLVHGSNRKKLDNTLVNKESNQFFFFFYERTPGRKRTVVLLIAFIQQAIQPLIQHWSELLEHFI